MTNVLTRETGMQDKITPTGRQLGVVAQKHGSMYTIQFLDGKGGNLPDSLKGMYTTKPRAFEALDNFLNEFWNTSDSVSVKKKA